MLPQELERRWIGCDIAILSIKLIRDNLTGDKYRLSEGDHFSIGGIPVSVEQAKELFLQDPFQFEHWVVERIGGFPTKKTADKGIDGRLYFDTKDGLKSMVLSVKGGKTSPAQLRELRGVLDREKEATLAGFICFTEPTKSMRDEAAAAGQYEYFGTKYDRDANIDRQRNPRRKEGFPYPIKINQSR